MTDCARCECPNSAPEYRWCPSCRRRERTRRRNTGVEKWRTGLDGLVAAIVRRAMLDWRKAADVTPIEARRFAAITKGSSVVLATCRFAVAIGFDSPAEELTTFFESGRLRRLMELAGVAAHTETILKGKKTC